MNINKGHAAAYYKWATMELRRGRNARARDLLQRGIWGCAGVAPPVEMAKMHRAKGQLEANSTLRKKYRIERTGKGGEVEALAWQEDAEIARASFRKALDLSAAAATFAAWTRFEEQLGEVGRARALLEDGLKTVPTDASVWREFVAFEMRHNGPQAADAARDRARQVLAG